MRFDVTSFLFRGILSTKNLTKIMHWTTAILLMSFLIVIRFVYVLYNIRTAVKKGNLKRTSPVRTMVIIGSGGHTAEMISLLRGIKPMHYSPRTYVMASSDTTSKIKILELERTRFSSSKGIPGYEIVMVPRSRRVGQSYITSVFTTLYALFLSFPIVYFKRPELILCNGPGTCIPICAIAFLLKLLFICDTKIVFIESICRVQTLSLSGKILLSFADEIFVQWPKLHEIYARTKYIGRIS